MPVYSKKQIISFITQLLHPTSLVDTSYFPVSQTFWDRLVKFGSGHLVLPAIYGALKRKKLEHLPPTELLSFLEKIKDLNKKRNTDILEQINFLSNLFKSNKIEHVFLKGAALLISKTDYAMSERMIGDIDILVSERNLIDAQQILIQEGFSKVPFKEYEFSKTLVLNDKHLDELIHPNFIAAVELHRYLLDTNNSLISPSDVLKNKVKSKKNHWIPSNYHIWQHSILNWQHNDKGMALNYLAFRSVLDVLHTEPKNFMTILKTSPKSMRYFYSLLSLHYNGYETYNRIKKLFYRWQLESKFFFNAYRFIRNIVPFIVFVFLRTILFFKSRIYRKRVFKNPILFFQRIFRFWKV